LTSWEGDDLRTRGFSADAIFGMSPDYARSILADPECNWLTERYGKGGDAPPDTLCRVCKKPGARLFGEPRTAGLRQDRFPGFTPLHLECCPKFFESSLPMEGPDEHGADEPQPEPASGLGKARDRQLAAFYRRCEADEDLEPADRIDALRNIVREEHPTPHDEAAIEREVQIILAMVRAGGGTC
jgi:hypothetical protein